MVYPHETHPHLGAGHTDAIALGRKDLGEGLIFSPSEFTGLWTAGCSSPIITSLSRQKKNHLPHLQLQAISRCCHVLGFLLLLALGHSRHLRCAVRARRDAHEGLHAALAQQRQDTKEEEGQHRRASHFCCVSGRRSDWKFGGPITLRAERSQRRCWKRTQFAEALTWFQSKFEDRLQKQLFKCSASRPHHCFESLAPRLHQVGIEQVLSEMSANPSSWEHKSTTNPPSPSVVIHLPFGSHPGWKSNPRNLRYHLLIIFKPKNVWWSSDIFSVIAWYNSDQHKLLWIQCPNCPNSRPKSRRLLALGPSTWSWSSDLWLGRSQLFGPQAETKVQDGLGAVVGVWSGDFGDLFGDLIGFDRTFGDGNLILC